MATTVLVPALLATEEAHDGHAWGRYRFAGSDPLDRVVEIPPGVVPADGRVNRANTGAWSERGRRGGRRGSAVMLATWFGWVCTDRRPGEQAVADQDVVDQFPLPFDDAV